MSRAHPQPMPVLDFKKLPFTERDSRVLAFLSDNHTGLRLATAEYERHPDDCVLLRELTVTTSSGAVIPVALARPDRIEFAAGAGSLVFAGPNTLSLGLCPGDWTVTLRLPQARLTGWGGQWQPGLPAAQVAAWHAIATSHCQHTASGPDDVRVQIDLSDPVGAQLIIGTAASDGSPPTASPHPRLVADAEVRWANWFRQLPAVPQHLASAARVAWWTLAANTLPLSGVVRRSAVMPSKLGYVGHWQWDAYFIAAGLRHMLPDLAREQIQLVLDNQRPDGMFVDVIHDGGVVASTTDLPPDEMTAPATLLATNAAVSPAGKTVPVTKPPLTAWAVNKIHQASPDQDFLADCFAAIQRNQRWWLSVSDTDRDGLAEYLHPYSSGLDDSPVFDQGAPVTTPDLNTYLTVQFDELATIASDLRLTTSCGRLRACAAEHVERMIDRQWDPAGRFRPLGRGRPLGTHTVTDLLPLLTGRLPGALVEAITADLADPATFGAAPAIPTVSRADPSYNPDRMWRGPVWMNTNYLLIEGLRQHGRTEAARQLTEQTLQLVCSSGPYEYFNAATGRPATHAVPMFSWTAALFLDLAVSEEGLH